MQNIENLTKIVYLGVKSKENYTTSCMIKDLLFIEAILGVSQSLTM